MNNKTKTFIDKSNKIHNYIYDYTLSNYKNAITKVKIICPTHGIFEQLPKSHLNGKGCKRCGSTVAGKKNTHTINQFILKSKKIHGEKYDYSAVQYKNNYTKIKIICPIHGVFEQLPKSHLKGNGCNTCGEAKRQKTTSFSAEQFIKKSKEIHGEQYDYSKVNYFNYKTHVNIICPKHGEFKQLASVHLKGSGCKRCAFDNLMLSSNAFIEKANLIHKNNYLYLNDYSGFSNPVTVICPKHGEFKQTAGNHLKGSNCPRCVMSNISKPEQEIYEFLKLYIEENKIKKNCRTLISPFEVDFFVPDKELAIEFDGIRWHSELIGNKNRYYHLNKTKKCLEKGIRLIHIFENEWIEKKNIVLSRLRHILGKSTKIYARKCSIEQITHERSNNFMNDNHTQGFSAASIHIGLFVGGIMVAVMTFGRARFQKNIQWELIRYANRLNTNVIGGASKLFKYFIKSYVPDSIISYSDKRWNSGMLYKILGFQYSHSSTPNYYYFKQTNHLMSRHKFQKHKLKHKLPIFNSNLSEWRNMINNGYNRIWDCGNDVFVWKNSI